MCQDDYLVNQVQHSVRWVSEILSLDWIKFSNTVTWDTFAQVAIIVAGFVFVGMQLKAQRKLQEKGLKDKIRYDAYKEFAGDFAKSFPSGAAESLKILIKEFHKALEFSSRTTMYKPPAITHESIVRELEEASHNLSTLIAKMERYEIVSPHMSIFRKVLSYKSTELHEVSLKLTFKLAYYLQDKEGEEVTKSWVKLTEVNMSDLKGLVNNYDKIAWDISYFLDDLNTELQNTLLDGAATRKQNATTANKLLKYCIILADYENR